MKELVGLFVLFGAIQGFFLLVIITFKKRKFDIFLFGFIFSMSIFLLLRYFSIKDYYFDFPHLIGLIVPLPFLHGPFIYLYVRLKLQGKNFTTNQFYHFIPFFINFLYYIVTFYFKSSTYKLNYYQFIKSGNIIPSLMTLQSVQNVHSLIYSLMAIFFISNYEKNAENNFSDIKSVEFLWLKRFLFFILTAWFLFNFVVVLGFVSFGGSSLSNKFYFIVITFVIYFVFYFEFPRENLSEIDKKALTILMDETQEDRRYLKSKINKEDSSKYILDIKNYLEDNKSFNDPEFTIQNLSDGIRIPKNKISQLLNVHLDINFYNLINSYRVEEAKKIFIEENENKINILNVAFTVGFNSKSTFNAAFKKYTNFTPSQFIKNIQKK